MTSGNIEVGTETKKRVYISLPKKYITELEKTCELDHGLVITEINSYLNEGYIIAYFREWGTVTSCKLNRPSPGNGKSVAFLRFSSEDEADRADWAGPHYIGGMEVMVKRFVSPKMEDEPTAQDKEVSFKPQPRRSMGLGYILEDAQWLDDEINE